MKPTEELLEPIRRVFGWLLGLRAEGGRIVCPCLLYTSDAADE